MHNTLVKRISQRLYSHGVSRGDSIISAVALATAWYEDRNSEDPRAVFAGLAERIGDADYASGLQTAADWLVDPNFSAAQWDALAAALADLRSSPVGPIDWSAELEASFIDTRLIGADIGPPLSIARSLSRAISVPISVSCGCMFGGATSIAWVMSGERPVTLFTGDREIAVVTALLARAACRPLKVDRRNPLDGSFMPVTGSTALGDGEPPFGTFDHIISLPPFGLRLQDGPEKGLPLEIAQIVRLAARASHAFYTVVTDGALFRENRQETSIRGELVERYGTTVMSLPQGIFASSNVSTSLVHLDQDVSERAVCLTDARSMEKMTSGRAPEQAIARHLEQFHGLHSRDPERTTVANWDQLEASNFSFLPERYLKSENLARVEDALKDRPLVALEEVATIERSKAPLPIRDAAIEPPLQALEIAPSDIVDGVVREPMRRVGFEQDQASALSKVAIRHGDILVSIKGNVGIVGLVDVYADLAALLKEPWIVSQSLAIIRLRRDGPIESSAVLNAILTAPWVREKLESMSGGSTVRTLPISALRSLTIPVPTPEETAEAEGHLKTVDDLRVNVTELNRNINETRSAIWHSLWHVAPELGDE